MTGGSAGPAFARGSGTLPRTETDGVNRNARRNSRRSQHVTSTHLTPPERQALLDHYRRAADPDVRRRAPIPLLGGAGRPWATVSAVLFCSARAISRWKRRFETEGVAAGLGRPRGRRRSGVHVWATLVA